jgi:hypothetical protein
MTVPNDRSRPRPAAVYLWLNCEGWVRFGPFQWLRFEAGPLRVCDQDKNVIAEFDGADWRTEQGDYRNYRWRCPMITSSPRHPHPSHG